MSFETDTWQILYSDPQKSSISTFLSSQENKSRRLTVNLIQCFCLYYDGSRQNVLYVGPDSGHAISVVSMMFPSLIFYVPSTVKIRESEKIKIYSDVGQVKNPKYLISDLVSIDEEKKLVVTTNPQIAFLNFNLSTTEKRVVFPNGTLLRYIWSVDPECRLAVVGGREESQQREQKGSGQSEWKQPEQREWKEPEQREWDVQRILGQLNFDNAVRKGWTFDVRDAKYESSAGDTKLKYEEAYELSVISAYLQKYGLPPDLAPKIKLLIDQNLPGGKYASKSMIRPEHIFQLGRTFKSVSRAFGSDAEKSSIDIIDATGKDAILLAQVFPNARIVTIGADLGVLANQPSNISSRIKPETKSATEYIGSNLPVDMIVVFPDLEQELQIDGSPLGGVISSWVNKAKLVIVHVPVTFDPKQLETRGASVDKTLWDIPSKNADYKLAIYRPKAGDRAPEYKRYTAKSNFPQRVLDACPDYRKLKTTPESAYSSLLPGQRESVAGIFTRVMTNPKLIIDATAHIGCDAINLARTYPEAKIIAVEKDAKTFALLNENIKILTLTNIETVNADALEYLSRIPGAGEADIVYFDPPWGGRDYRSQTNLMLELSGKPIWEVINGTKAKYVVLKAPNNFDINTFRSGIKGMFKVEQVYDENKHVYNLIVVTK